MLETISPGLSPTTSYEANAAVGSITDEETEMQRC
jgi:hypothetical protein